MRTKITLFIAFSLFTMLPANAQTVQSQTVADKITEALNGIEYQKYGLDVAPKLTSFEYNKSENSVIVKLDDALSKSKINEKEAEKLCRKIQSALESTYKDSKVVVISDGKKIMDIANENDNRGSSDKYDWGNINYTGKPWVTNASRPINITKGLQNRHISIWASHGRYFDQKTGKWQWQRPNLFGTTEDLYTQTIVTPFLIPMLQNAGAVVFSPRERDGQKNEVIVDNDNSQYRYTEGGAKKWSNTHVAGFKLRESDYNDGENPFTEGTARKIKTTGGKRISYASYQPNFPQNGKYAVYVSYQTIKKSTDDAEYIVYHKGRQTTFHVNQQMGGGTWAYLGSFDFDEGSSEFNRVVVTNHSTGKGFVTTDAIRFGGGMGNIKRGGNVSGLPRCLEGARYNVQWSGAPREVVSIFQGNNDYNDDINSRSLMANWLAGGSCYVPFMEGKHVPLELSIAVHSDAGYSKGKDLTGTLGICMSNFKGDTNLNSGLSRSVSKSFAQGLVDQIKSDVEGNFGISWTTRGVWDKNYNECRRPEVPSAIVEVLSHQNFNDMKYGQDPNFKFTLARAIYKEITKYIAGLHHTSYIIEPLAPKNFRLSFKSKNTLELQWNGVSDAQEATATPNSYVVYTAVDNSDFDNGTVVNASNYTITLTPGRLYRFKVTAANAGGESFPTDELAAQYSGENAKKILIVNNFHRLSSPAIIDDDVEQGFDFYRDPGVQYGTYAGWNGSQTNFDKSQIGKDGSAALGFGGDELAGTFVKGNSFDYVTEHARALSPSKRYNIVSSSADAVINGNVNLANYNAVDLINGLEQDDGHSLVKYKSFPTILQNIISNYTAKGGRIFVSGAYVGSDMQGSDEKKFLSSVLKTTFAGQNRDQVNTKVTGLGTDMDVWRSMNEDHYACVATDALNAVNGAYSAMRYADGTNAAIAYDGNDYKAFVMGFPVECIKEVSKRNSIISGIISFILK